ncbi:MAG TPA: MFS transporter [Humisphaera sp.]|nr:MFS transporter [Humisphaera sp.]
MPQAAAALHAPRSSDRFLHIVPLAFITYSLAFLDRVNYGYAAAAGMSETLHLSKNVAALLPSLFFPGYCLLQIPAAHWAAKRNLKWLVFWALILWGIFSSLTGILRSVPALIAVRLALGAVEGVVLPAMLVFLTRWFTKPERSRANALLLLANPLTMMFVSVVSGLLIAHFDVHPVWGLKGWQMMFIIEGMPSIIWAGIWLAAADERPAEARWLTADDADAIQNVLDAEQRQMTRISSYWAALADRRVILWSLMYLSFSACGYGMMFWMPTIIKAATARGIAATGLLSAIPYAVGILPMLTVSYLSDRTLKRKPFAVASMFVASVGYLIAFAGGEQHFYLTFAGMIIIPSCTYTLVSVLWAWMADTLPRNVVGESMALVNSAGSAGGWLGSYFFGLIIGKFGTRPGFVALAGMFAIAGVLAVMVKSASVRPLRDPGS